MRKLLSLMLVLSGLSVACGSDSKSDNPPADGDGSTDETTDPVGGDGTEDGDDGITVPDAGSPGGDGDGDGSSDVDVKYPECPREMIGPYPGYDGEIAALTLQQLQACIQACGQNDEACVEQMCPGYSLVNDCVNAEATKCGVDPGGPCTNAYTNYVCCGAAAQCQDQDCVVQNCPEDDAALGTCFQSSAVQTECVGIETINKCLNGTGTGGDGSTGDGSADGSDGADAGVVGDGGADGNSIVRPRVKTPSALIRFLAR